MLTKEIQYIHGTRRQGSYSGPDIPGYGNLVMISHPNGFLSLYAHCKDIFVVKRVMLFPGSNDR